MLGGTIGPVVECPESPAAPGGARDVVARVLNSSDASSTRSPEPRVTATARPARPFPDLPRTNLSTDFDPDDRISTTPATPLAVAVDDRGGVFVVHADGEVDLSTAPLLDGALDAGLASGRRTVVVDLRQVSFIDCTGIGLLTRARCRARRQGTRLHIHAGRAVARTAALLDLTVTLGLHETLAVGTERSA